MFGRGSNRLVCMSTIHRIILFSFIMFSIVFVSGCIIKQSFTSIVEFDNQQGQKRTFLEPKEVNQQQPAHNLPVCSSTPRFKIENSSDYKLLTTNQVKDEIGLSFILPKKWHIYKDIRVTSTINYKVINQKDILMYIQAVPFTLDYHNFIQGEGGGLLVCGVVSKDNWQTITSPTVSDFCRGNNCHWINDRLAYKFGKESGGDTVFNIKVYYYDTGKMQSVCFYSNLDSFVEEQAKQEGLTYYDFLKKYDNIYLENLMTQDDVSTSTKEIVDDIINTIKSIGD